MKRILIILCTFLAISTLNISAQSVIYPQVTLLPDESFQTIAGFGASLAYYENWLTAHPKKGEIYDAIFRELSLDILRVRNAYGYDNTMITRVKEFSQAAQKSLGHPIDILVTSWGPPAYLKSNNDRNNGGTIRYSVTNGKVVFDYAGFAQWWNQSLDDYARNGIYPTYISIQNEPDWKASYESCLLKPAETITASDTIAGYNKALDAVYDTIQKRSHIPLFLGPENVGIGYFGQSQNEVHRFINALDINKLHGIAHHLYHGADEEDPWSSADFAKMGAFKPLVPHFQTEYSRGKWFPLAGMIHKSLNDENAVAYLFWDLIWNEGGLVTLDNPWYPAQWKLPNGYQRTKHFWVFKQFSAWIHPGWKRVKVNSPSIMVKTTAFLSSGRDSATLVAINTSGTTSYGLKAAIEGYTIDQITITRTSASEDGVTVTMPADSVLITPQSITTIAMKISQINTSATIKPRPKGLNQSCHIYPTPIRDEATLRFSPPETGEYSITVYDISGRVIKQSSLGYFNPGEVSATVNRDNLKAGIYLFRVETNGIEAGRGKLSVTD